MTCSLFFTNFIETMKIIYDRVKADKYLSSGCDCLVFRAVLDSSQSKSPSTAKDVAIKICRTKYLNPNIETILKIDHENLEKIIYHVSLGEHTFIYSRLLNKTLVKYNIKSDPPLKYLVLDMLNALFYLHGLKLAHCDIKANNIMLDFAGRFVLIDFNNCQEEEKFGKFPLATTLGERHVDLIVNALDWDYKIDLWAMGTVVYLLLTGHHLLFKVLDTCQISEVAADEDRLSVHERWQLKVEWNTNVLPSLYIGGDYLSNRQDETFQIVHFCMNLKAITLEVIEQYKSFFLYNKSRF